MRKITVFVFVMIMAGSVSSGICSLRRTANRIDSDVQGALQATMTELPCDRVDMDTLSRYRSHITIADIRDTAYIAMKTVSHEGRQETVLIAESGCGLTTLMAMSDWKVSGLTMGAALLWLLTGAAFGRRRGKVAIAGVAYGGLTYVEDGPLFLTSDGKELALTPMQRELMEMFFKAGGHTLTKQEICDRLWPRKPDASDTLYTLIRRLRTIVETRGGLQITSERGKSYSLEPKDR